MIKFLSTRLDTIYILSATLPTHPALIGSIFSPIVWPRPYISGLQSLRTGDWHIPTVESEYSATKPRHNTLSNQSSIIILVTRGMRLEINISYSHFDH